jgi:hypothetical protein
MVMFFTSIMTCFITSHIYNEIAAVIIDDAELHEFLVDETMGMTNSGFMKAAACGMFDYESFAPYALAHSHILCFCVAHRLQALGWEIILQHSWSLT